MTRFVDKKATHQVDLGPCKCPPNADGSLPHSRDEATVRDSLSYGEMLKAIKADEAGDGAMSVILMRVTSWSLRAENGEPVPVTRQSVEDLDYETAQLIHKAAVEDYQGQAELPND